MLQQYWVVVQFDYVWVGQDVQVGMVCVIFIKQEIVVVVDEVYGYVVVGQYF